MNNIVTYVEKKQCMRLFYLFVLDVCWFLLLFLLMMVLLMLSSGQVLSENGQIREQIESDGKISVELRNVSFTHNS